MKYKYAILLVSSFLGLVACGDDDEGHAPTVRSESAEWSVLVDGNLLEGDKIEVTDTEERGIVMKFYQSSGNNAVSFGFGSDQPDEGLYVTDNQFAGVYYFTDTLLSVPDGELNIIKYNSDSLVATFEFGVSDGPAVPSIVLTEGIVKAKLK
jgi:hypothetical protein